MKHFLFFPIIYFLLSFNLHELELNLALVEAPPYMSESIDGFGFEAVLVEAAFEIEEINVCYAFHPVARALRYVEVGASDGLVGFVYSEERAEYAVFSDPIVESPLVFFHLKSLTFDWNSFNDLEEYLVCTMLGSFYTREFANAIKNGSIKIHELRDHEFSFTALLNKRVDLFPYNFFAGMYYINSKLDREKAELITYNEKPIKTSIYHLLLSKKLSNHLEVLEKFNSGLQKIKDNGTYDRILEQYNMK